MEHTILKTNYPNPSSLSHHSFIPQLPPIIEENTCNLDQQYTLLRQQITSSPFFNSTSKHIRIRLIKWLQQLDNIKVNKLWKSNRNNYIKLLNLMCQCEYLSSPFNAFPEYGDLPTLKKHEINEIIDDIQRGVKKVSRACTKKTSYYVTERQQIKCSKIDSMTATINESTRIQMSLTQSDHFKKNNLIFNQEKRDSKENRNKQLHSLPKQYTYDEGRISKSKNIAIILKGTPPNESYSLYEQHRQEGLSYNTGYKNGKLDLQEIDKSYFSSQLITQRVKNMTKLSNKENYFTKQSCQQQNIRKSIARRDLKQVKAKQTIAAPQQQDMNNQQYWESNSFTMNGTPRYLKDGLSSVESHANESVQFQEETTFRNVECSCHFFDYLKGNWLNNRYKRKE